MIANPPSDKMLFACDLEKNENEFSELLFRINRPGIPEMINFLGNSEFFTSPASTKYHGNYPGGLCEHSLNVYKLFEAQNKLFEKRLPSDSVILCGLLHDLCKIGLYRISGVKYTINENHAAKKHHALLSLKIIEDIGLQLTNREKEIIKYHMGIFGAVKFNQWDIQEYTPEDLRTAIQNDVMVQVFATCDNVEAQLMNKRQVNNEKHPVYVRDHVTGGYQRQVRHIPMISKKRGLFDF